VTTQAEAKVPADEVRPSERARMLVRGAYDLHVHVAPDVPPRRIDDVTLARRFAEAGLAGFGLKSHYTSTAERAQVVSGLVPEVEAIGALALNQAVGGMNPLAVEIAAREGARIVWMPTVDSPAETAGRTAPKPGDKVPQWARLQHELRELGLGIEPVHVTGADGRLLPDTRDVLGAIARHGLILATGHLARDDTFAVVDGALEEGVTEIVVTHPEFTCQNFSIDDQVELARRGCLLERCLTTPFSGKTTWEHVFAGVRAVGVERTLFSSDCGNPNYPPVEDGLALWADRLLGADFDEDEVGQMIVGQSRRLAGAA
jgi:stage V sporulation protein SpoVS